MTTFHLSAAHLSALAALTNAGSKDKVTPILGAVQITVTPATVTAHATDRYVAARLTFPLGDTAHTLPDDGVTLVIDGPDLVALAKDKCGFMLTTDDADATLITAEGDAYGVRRAFHTVQGSYPPIARLFPDETPDDIPGGMLMSMALLGRIAKLTLPGERPVDAAKHPYAMTYAAPKDNYGRTAPLVATRETAAGSLRVLAMSNYRPS